MKWLHRIVSRETLGMDAVRLAVCAILFVHGSYRFYLGEVGDLGDFLVECHVPLGHLVAFLVTFTETVGTVLLAFRILAVPICLFLSCVYFTGIMMFNRHDGFFVVGGHAHGGWEYNALLIVCLLATAWENRAHWLY